MRDEGFPGDRYSTRVISLVQTMTLAVLLNATYRQD